MSSMRNAVQRRTHRERGQVSSRRHLGLLEKHKDYSLRASDYNKKQATLKSLRRKAAERNEDEFDFGMLSRAAGPGSRLGQDTKRWKGTVAGDRGNTALGVDAVRLLKTQDAGYLRTVRNVAAKEVRLLEERVVLAGGERPGKKVVFVDGVQEREAAAAGARSSNLTGVEDEDDEDQDEDEEPDGTATNAAGGKATVLERLERRLGTARARLKALTEAEDELDLQRARMSKTATVGGITKKGNSFKIRERKR